MKFFRSLGRVYDQTKYVKQTTKQDIPASFGDYSTSNRRIRLDVKQKVDNKYEPRSLEIVRRVSECGEQEWMLYVVKYADYTSYDYFRLSHGFITQLFNERDFKCTLVLVEDVLRFKMASVSDKWRLVEFLRANLDYEGHLFNGSLKRSPTLKKAEVQPVRLMLLNSTVVIVDSRTNSLLLHTSIANFDMVVCRDKTISFVCRNSQNVCDFWSVQLERTELMDKLAAIVSDSRSSQRLSFAFTHHHEQSKYTQPPHTPYTDF